MKIVRAVSEKNGSLMINKNNNNEGDLIGPAPTSVGGPKLIHHPKFSIGYKIEY